MWPFRLPPLVDLWCMTLLAQVEESFWLPPPASTDSPIVNNLFYILLGVSIFFFTLIVGVMTLFVIVYRRREGVEPSPSPSHNNALEVVWTSIPILIVGFIFYEGVTGYMELRTSPRQAYEIRVVARQWLWMFEYPNGHKDEQLHVPTDESVRLVMRSDDVIHGFYIPDFRVQMDVVPGRYTTIWFRAKEPGEHDLYCANIAARTTPTCSPRSWSIGRASSRSGWPRPAVSSRTCRRPRPASSCTVAADVRNVTPPTAPPARGRVSRGFSATRPTSKGAAR